MKNLSTEERMRELVNTLNSARDSYHNGGAEQLSNREYDKLLTELVKLEKLTGVRDPNSPTSKIGAEVHDDKAIHFAPVLSLKSTKSMDEMLRFLGEHEGVLSPKLDGISVVLYYDKGELVQALTRGNGLYGRVITENARMMMGVPEKLRTNDAVIIRGEGVISFEAFEALNAEGKYSNPRNAVASILTSKNSVNALHAVFLAYEVIYSETTPAFLEYTHQLIYLTELGFEVVTNTNVLNFELKNKIDEANKKVKAYQYPIDGYVLRLNNIEFGNNLGKTAKWPKHSIAYKWSDEVVETTVIGMKWSTSSKGLITPVVIFEPVQLEGTVVKQASLHTLKKFEALELGVFSKIEM